MKTENKKIVLGGKREKMWKMQMELIQEKKRSGGKDGRREKKINK